MRKFYTLGFIIVAALFSSCGKGGQGELVGVYNRKFNNKKMPLGMVYIPQGKTLIGMSDEDINNSQTSPARMTSFSAFYMDETEITNAEYRQFVNWVRDSVALTSLGPGAAPTFFINAKATPGGATLSSQKNIDWKKVGNGSALWSGKNSLSSKLKDMYYSGDDALPGRNELDIRKFRYSYSFVNLDLAEAGRKD
ncbi:MAG: SUMF1/EgtB/PvdO family nonheme iron enzyme, partial [Pedobacter sp.]|nr:SUMF1/EgtB/PvdO family nonheme iron enzyme [Pedobacter sp.]